MRARVAGPHRETPRPRQLKRQIVVGFLERSGEILEISPASRRRPGLGSGRCRRAAPSAALAIKIAATRATATAAEHHELAHVDLGAVASLILLVLPLAILDATFDEELIALLAVLLDDVGQPCAFGVPHHAPVPLRLLLLLTICRIPRPARRERECRDPVATRRRADFGIAAQVSDQHHFIQTSAHCASWREFVPAQNSIDGLRARANQRFQRSAKLPADFSSPPSAISKTRRITSASSTGRRS